MLLLLGLNDEVSQLVRALASVHTRIDVHQVGDVKGLHRLGVDGNEEATHREGQQTHYYQQQRRVLDSFLVAGSVLQDQVDEEHCQGCDAEPDQQREDLNR